ncbi:MAG: hypothetical protein ABFD98_19535 [Syntrophobacteraceae bacterium]|nr:hypothetical protein [Desulfobacteraceae bacterium]
MIQDWQANASATLVGSLPHRERRAAVDTVLRNIGDIPAWPQLSVYPAEQMMIQYLEGLPGLRNENGRITIEADTPEFDNELYAFYEEYLEIEAQTKDIDHSRFRMGPETAETFLLFLEALKSGGRPLRAVKGQVVGPFTLLAGLKDRNDRSVLYDERFQDIVPKHLAMKALWQIRRLSALGCPVIVFLDEPALAGFGSSAFISVSRELIQQLLEETIAVIHQADALAGIHVCANTDWLLAFHSSVDIINFDAYNYFDKFNLYRDDFHRFMEEGRIVAWGMVPTGEASLIEAETAAGLEDRWLRQVQDLVSPEVPLQKILSQSLFTPSCGCGSLSEAAALKVVELTRDLGTLMQNRLRG